MSEKPSVFNEAAQWLIKLESGSCDQGSFERWRDADPRHVIAFAEVAQRWNQMDGLARDKTSQSSTLKATPRLVMSKRTMLQAASVAIIVGGAGLFASRAVARVLVETRLGERRVVRISQGVEIELNTQSEVLYRLSEDQFKIWPKSGEVRLDIAQGVPKTYVVAGQSQTLLAPGQYNVRQRGTAFDIMVLSGAATIEGMPSRPKIMAGQSALVGNTTIQLRPIEPMTRQRAEAWRQGEVVFAGESLDFVVSEFNRYLEQKIIIGDSSLSTLRLGGRFTSSDPKEFLSALDASFGVAVTKDSTGTIILTQRP
jgi:transmembrane sensor